MASMNELRFDENIKSFETPTCIACETRSAFELHLNDKVRGYQQAWSWARSRPNRP